MKKLKKKNIENNNFTSTNDKIEKLQDSIINISPKTKSFASAVADNTNASDDSKIKKKIPGIIIEFLQNTNKEEIKKAIIEDIISPKLKKGIVYFNQLKNVTVKEATYTMS